MNLQYNYQLGGFRIRLISDEPLCVNPETQLFASEFENSMADLTCHLHIVDILPNISGSCVSKSLENRVYFDGCYVWQERIDRMDDTPILVSKYRVDGGDTVEIWGLRRYLSYTTRTLVLWPALDLPYQLLSRGVFTLHSASVDVDGRVILFAAASGTGKSTQASLWHTYRNASQLNGDKNCLQVENGCVAAFGTPFCGTSAICAKFSLPVKAIVFLSQAQTNTVRRVRGVEALKLLMENGFGHKAIPGCMPKMMEIAGNIAQNVPIFHLSCTPDVRAVEALEMAMGEE